MQNLLFIPLLIFPSTPLPKFLYPLLSLSGLPNQPILSPLHSFSPSFPCPAISPHTLSHHSSLSPSRTTQNPTTLSGFPVLSPLHFNISIHSPIKSCYHPLFPCVVTLRAVSQPSAMMRARRLTSRFRG